MTSVLSITSLLTLEYREWDKNDILISRYSKIYSKGGRVMDRIKTFLKRAGLFMMGVVSSIVAFLVYSRVNKKSTTAVEEIEEYVEEDAVMAWWH